MIKKYIFSIEEELDTFQIELSEYIGPAAFYINSLWLGERLIELFFYGGVFGDIKCVERFLDGLKIPTEKVEDLSYQIKSSIERKIYHCIPDYSENRSYNYKVTSLADVIIEDIGPANMTANDKVKDLISEIEENIANGDYLPERYRRLVG